MSMLLLPTLVLLSGLHCSALVVTSIPQYEHQDPLTGKTLHCNRCPPGTHMVSHCTATTQTQCADCPNEYFTELWNYLPRCLYCHSFCTGNQEVERECSPTSDRVCRCKEGFYSTDDFCIPHTECGPGHGVHSRGSLKTNTVCEKCSEGFYSASTSSLDSCVKHEKCANGQIALLPGSVYHNTVCGSCENLASGGETLRIFLSGFFHKMRVSKIRKFVIRYVHDSEEDLCIGNSSVSKERGPLLEQILKWLHKTPVEQLRRMPQKLRNCQLNVMAGRLEKRLSDIQQLSPNCTLSF